MTYADDRQEHEHVQEDDAESELQEVSRRTGIRPPTGSSRQKCQRCPATQHPDTEGRTTPIR